ncbi:hypothetical protein [Streptomyces carpaticus]|uniref:Integral membrane protein n=1 Tax=Streptomyces carpaticus TaxID=285558 RepID=A0ABV4ZNN3_9ACTN
MSGTDDNTLDRGDLLVRIGGVVFAVGAVATLITFIPLFAGTEPFPTAAYAVSMLMGVGFALAGAGLLRSMAQQRRRDRAAQSASAAP